MSIKIKINNPLGAKTLQELFKASLHQAIDDNIPP